MFSGIQSLFFGKKHHRSHQPSVDGSGADKSGSLENDYIVIERRHSDEPDINPGVYPKIDPFLPPSGNLPYGVSPSLPDLRPQISFQKTGKEGPAVDLLYGVPFELASYIDVMTNEKDDKFNKLLQRFKEQFMDDGFMDAYDYDFNLENRILKEFQT